MSGKHLTGHVAYGYLWDEKRENWIVDEEAADVVRRIFAMTLEGYGPIRSPPGWPLTKSRYQPFTWGGTARG